MCFYRMLLCSAFLQVLVATQQDSLKQGEFINSSTTLVSSNNMFTLGFFHPKYSIFSYLGIWFTNPNARLNIEHPAWVANRNTPIPDSSGFLTIDLASGDLVIYNNATSPIILYSSGSDSRLNRTATLLDSGNFVLKEGNVTLWQSFDHPTDTLLPGMKLGINHKTNRTWSLTSWLGVGEPASGSFTLEWNPGRRVFLVKFRGMIYWTSGTLMNDYFEKFRTNMVEMMMSKFSYRYTNVTNENEKYFSYKIVNEQNDMHSISGWRLDYQGNIFDEDKKIALVDGCYGYDRREMNFLYAGCELWKQPKCRNDRQIFVILGGYFVSDYDNYLSIDNSSSHGFSDCKAICWEDCDCFGFTNYGDTGCLFFKGRNLMFKNDDHSMKIYALVSNPANPLKEGDKVMQIVFIAVGSFLLLMLLFGLLYFRRKRFKQAKAKEVQELLTLKGIGNGGRNDLKFFNFSSIAAATRNFSSDNKLGEGGFGPVYKGEFPHGQEVAVKRLSRTSTQGLVQLKNELILIARLQHINLVKIIGCCIHREDKMLIYEYMPNRSLDFFLFDESKRKQLTWERRFSIIEGIAQGILYLHKYSRLRIIHRDLKAANILLDGNMNPKISDFGLARNFMQNTMEASTDKVVGTFGYMAPEYAMEGIFSVKSDVYSFGVLILEIISGRKINSFYHVDEGPINLVAFAWELWNRNAAFELMDPSLKDSCIQHQFMRCIHVGLLCVEDRALDRPKMIDVISMLVNDTAVLPLPKKPAFYFLAFYTGSTLVEDESQDTKSTLYTGSTLVEDESQKISLNGLSISINETELDCISLVQTGV